MTDADNRLTWAIWENGTRRLEWFRDEDTAREELVERRRQFPNTQWVLLQAQDGYASVPDAA